MFDSFVFALKNTFDKGGPVMYVILAVSVYGAALVAERWIVYRRNEKELAEAIRLLSLNTTDGNKEGQTPEYGSIPGKLFETASNNQGLDKPGVFEKARTVFAEQSALVEARLGAISVIGSLLPMIGLLGTVVGMITAFNAIALHGTGDPKILADGISQALLTTQAGLVTSIPLLYLHHLLSERAEGIIRKMDNFLTRLHHEVFNGGEQATASATRSTSIDVI